MSLFPSAFDAGLSAASSSTPYASKGASTSGSNKRKRPAPSFGPRDAQFRITQANLEKLMRKVEQGNVGTKADGREAMGLPSKKKAKIAGGAPGGLEGKSRRKASNERHVERGPGEQRRQPRDAGIGRSGHHPKREDPGAGRTNSPYGARGSLVSRSHGNDGRKNGKERHEERPRPKVQAGRPVSSGHHPGDLAPAEIPLPHKIPSKKRKQDLDGDAMTDMQRDMQEKLEGARFRWINEQLYSTPSTEAVAMMRKDPKIFADYHMTHRALTSAWPSPPLPHLISRLTSLPAKTLIVDLGCGDAGLARALVPQGKIVLSYDLVGDSGVPGESTTARPGEEGWVIEADFLEHVPLPGRPGGLESLSGVGDLSSAFDLQENDEATPKASRKKDRKGKQKENASEVVDVVVCCLSLMGTNWVGGVYEACRILRQGGALHIAEVTSRFVAVPAFIAKIETFGFKLDQQQSPSTHFSLFSFIKQSELPLGPARGQRGWDARVKEGESILRGCVYKKR